MHDQCQIEQLCRLLSGIICQNEQLFLIVNRILEAANLTNSGLESLTETVNEINTNTSCSITEDELSLCEALDAIFTNTADIRNIVVFNQSGINTILSDLGEDGGNTVFSLLNQIIDLVNCELSIPGVVGNVSLCVGIQNLINRLNPRVIVTSQFNFSNIPSANITSFINNIDLPSGQTACALVNGNTLTITNNGLEIEVTNLLPIPIGPFNIIVPAGTEFFTCI